ncbi:MAG: excinuclease ABC subunit UvrA [Candidatus Anstonellaceae archaeon]
MEETIKIFGAKEHNLKNINLEIPKEKLVVFCGVSGCGKTTLAFDTIYAEGHRRYVESLSTYARQFIGLSSKPDVEKIEGLSPSISIDQKTVSFNPRSTVGTTTEIYDYLRLLFAKIGQPYCPNCNILISSQSIEKIIEKIFLQYSKQKITVIAPIVIGQKGSFEKLFEQLQKEGFDRVVVDKKNYLLSREKIELDKNKYHDIDIVIDRIEVVEEERGRILEAVELGLKKAAGLIKITDGKKEEIYSQKKSCSKCGFSFKEIEPRSFSFNSPYGACDECHGIGIKFKIDPNLVIKDKRKSLIQGAIEPWNNKYSLYNMQVLFAFAKRYGIPINEPIEKLTEKQIELIMYGSSEPIEILIKGKDGGIKWHGWKIFEGVANHLERTYNETDSEQKREEIQKYIREVQCSKCKGKRLKDEVLSIRINEKNIVEITDMPIKAAYGFFKNLKFEKNELLIAKPIIKEISSRLEFLINVGLDYLTLSRATKTLSGGEAQRIRLATQIGSNLSGVIYVLDEPSVGLHPKDTAKLIATLRNLRDLGNSVIVVEHDEETIKNADFIVELGPGAGENGGEVVFAGPKKDFFERNDSLTLKYIKKEKKILIPKKRREPKKWLNLFSCNRNNLKEIDIAIPLGVFCAISGVSGSGKSSLISETLCPILEHWTKNKEKNTLGLCKEIRGIEQVKRLVIIDQRPIGKTPRSNPATYIGAFGPIRELFAQLPLSKAKGWKSGRFSFNVPGGRCIKCGGGGIIKIEMNFLPDLYIPCDECNGKRYDNETLSVRYKGKNIYEVLEMSVGEAYKFFENIPQIKRKLQGLMDVGLDYIKLGQSATTLSGGEAQRVKLAAELNKNSQEDTIYILDEPTTGLHFAEVEKLIKVLNSLVENKNSVLIVEHNLEILKSADYIIDLGPEGGDRGGEIVAYGTPEEIAKNSESYTGQYLQKLLKDKC